MILIDLCFVLPSSSIDFIWLYCLLNQAIFLSKYLWIEIHVNLADNRESVPRKLSLSMWIICSALTFLSVDFFNSSSIFINILTQDIYWEVWHNSQLLPQLVELNRRKITFSRVRGRVIDFFFYSHNIQLFYWFFFLEIAFFDMRKSTARLYITNM